jgi:hypothetical protein
LSKQGTPPHNSCRTTAVNKVRGSTLPCMLGHDAINRGVVKPRLSTAWLFSGQRPDTTTVKNILQLDYLIILAWFVIVKVRAWSSSSCNGAAMQYRCPLPGVQLSLYKTSFSDRNVFMLLAQPTRVEFFAERQVMVESLLTSGCVSPVSA